MIDILQLLLRLLLSFFLFFLYTLLYYLTYFYACLSSFSSSSSSSGSSHGIQELIQISLVFLHTKQHAKPTCTTYLSLLLLSSRLVYNMYACLLYLLHLYGIIWWCWYWWCGQKTERLFCSSRKEHDASLSATHSKSHTYSFSCSLFPAKRNDDEHTDRRHLLTGIMFLYVSSWVSK